jgi:hypothetical protein
MEEPNNEYVLTLYEACEILNKSARTVSRYVRRGLITPMSIRSRKGTLEYRFSREELESFKDREDEIRQVTFTEDEADETADAAAAQFAGVDMTPDRPMVEAPFVVPNVAPAPAPETSGMTGHMGSKQPAGSEIESRIEKLEQASDAKSADEEKMAGDGATQRPDKEIIDLLKETTGMLRDQLQVKDEQIKSLNDKIDNLIERDRETNILLKGLQDRFLYLEKPKPEQSRTSSAEAEIIQPAVVSGQPAKEAEEKSKGRKDRVEKPGKDNKNSKDKKADKERQDTMDKFNKQKKSNQDKPKKGFWGGLFGK